MDTQPLLNHNFWKDTRWGSRWLTSNSL